MRVRKQRIAILLSNKDYVTDVPKQNGFGYKMSRTLLKRVLRAAINEYGESETFTYLVTTLRQEGRARVAWELVESQTSKHNGNPTVRWND